MGWSLKQAYTISLDGSIKTAAKVTAPSDDYLKRAVFALVKNDLYAFGGWADDQKVRNKYFIYSC